MCLATLQRTYELEALLFRLRGLTATTNGTSPESISVIGLSLPDTPVDCKRLPDSASPDAASVHLPADPPPPRQVYVIVADKETISGLVSPFSYFERSPRPTLSQAAVTK